MMKDPRTPSVYFQKRGSEAEDTREIREELTEVLEFLIALQEDPHSSPVAKEVATKDLERLERKRYRHHSKKNAVKVMSAITDGTSEDVLEALKEALAFKILHRVEPQMMETGFEVEEQLFWSDLIGDK